MLRGCCFPVALLLLLAVAGVYVATRALATPNLGAAPGGTDHGNTQLLIAAALAGDAAAQLIIGDHAVVVVSEHDLTVIVQARNPEPQKYRYPQARIRDGNVVVSADTDVGPLGVTAVVRYNLVLDTSGPVQVTAQPVSYDVGQLGLPSFVGTWLNPRATKTVDLTSLFGSNPALQLLARSLDCLAVHPDGVHVGFHRPGATVSDPACT